MRYWSALPDVRTNAELTGASAVGVRWTTIGRAITEPVLLGTMVVLAHLLPPSAFGIAAVVIIVEELAVGVPSEGVGSAIVQRRTVDREHLQGGLALSLVVAMGLLGLTLLVAALIVKPLLGHQTAELIALSTIWFPLGAVVALPLTVLRRRLDFRRLAVIGLVQAIVRAASSTVLALLGLDAMALVLGGLVGICAMTIVALILAPVPLPRWRSKAIRDLLPYGGPAMLACFAWAGFRNGDYAVVGARLGAAQAGFYWRGYQLAVQYQNKVTTVMTQVAFPVLARTASAAEMFALRRRMTRLLAVILFPLLSLLVLLAPVVVPWLFGPAWEPAVIPTQVLAAGGAATLVIDAIGVALMAAGRTRAMLGYGLAHFAVYITAVLVASAHGLVAVSISAVVVHGAFMIVAYQLLLRAPWRRTARFLWDDLSAAAVSCMALVAVAWPVDSALTRSEASTPLIILIVGILGLVAYLLALRVWFFDAWRDLTTLARRVLPSRKLRRTVVVSET
jgi:O-antigen/teichoic acid export membrane protein